MRTMIALLLLAGSALAAPPVVVIDGPVEARPGQIVILDASASECDHLTWDVVAEVDVPEGADLAAKAEQYAEALRTLGYEVDPPVSDAPLLWLPFDDGRKLLTSSYPGTYDVVAAGSNAEGVTICRWRVTVPAPAPPPPGPGPGPQPGPDPDPAPAPDLPEGRFGLAPKAYKAAVQVTATTRKQDAALLAEGIDGLHAQMAAGQWVGTPQQLMVELSNITKARTANHRDWTPFWKDALGPELNRLLEAQRVAGRDDWLIVLAEISTGLKAASQ